MDKKINELQSNINKVNENFNKINKSLKMININLSNTQKRLDNINNLLEDHIFKEYALPRIHIDKKNELTQYGRKLTDFERFISNNTPQISFSTWFLDSSIIEDENTVFIEAPNRFYKGILEVRYAELYKTYGKEVIITVKSK